MWIMWITWCISLLFPQKRKSENVDNSIRTDVLKRISNGEKREKLCILSNEWPVREKGVENHIKIIRFFNGNWQKIDRFQGRRILSGSLQKNEPVIKWTGSFFRHNDSQCCQASRSGNPYGFPEGNTTHPGNQNSPGAVYLRSSTEWRDPLESSGFPFCFQSSILKCDEDGVTLMDLAA